MKRIKVFLFNGLLLTITSIVMQTVSLFFNVYISNKIGSEAIGLYGLVMSVYFFSITLATSGINLATMRIVSEQNAFGLHSGIKNATKKCIFYSLFMGFFAGLLLFFFSNKISIYWLHSKISDIPIKILAFTLPVLSLSSCINGYFSALRKVSKTVFTQILEQVFKFGFAICFLDNFSYGGLEGTCICLVLSSTIAEILSSIFLFIFFILDRRKFNLSTYSDNNFLKQILKIALPISFTSYIRSGLSTLKQLLIPISLEKFGLSCSDSLSQYGIINGMVMPLILFPSTFISSFSSLLIPEFSYMNAKKEQHKINLSLEKILKFCFIFSFLIMGIFWCFSKELNTFIYPNNDISYYIKLLCPLIVLIYIDNIVDSILKGLDKQVLVMGINILDLASSIFFIYFLLPWKGIGGYIIVLFFSEIINGLLSLILLIKKTNLKVDITNWILKPFFSIIILNLFFYNSNFSYNLFDFIFNLCIFAIMYFVIIILLRGIVRQDFSIHLHQKN